MEKQDLIKKLEKIKLPEIETSSHKNRLKMILIDWKYGKGKKAGWFFNGFKRVLVPLSTVAVVLIIALIVSNLIAPQYTFAEVKEIAMGNPQIKEWVEKGAEIKDIEIIKNKAYVLISPRELEGVPVETKKEEFRGALAEIEIKKKRVAKIEKIIPKIAPLTREEEERAKKMIKELEFPKNATETLEIEKIKRVSPRLELIKKDNRVEVLQKKEENVWIIYEAKGERKRGRVNLFEEKVEKIEILEESKSGDQKEIQKIE